MVTVPYTVVLHKHFNHQSFGIYIGEDIPSGLYIVTVEPNSPAAGTNIRPGDHVLAVNGQLVSTMPMNPKEMIAQIANQVDSLTLFIQPSNILELIDLFSSNNYQYLPQQKTNIDLNLENYMKSLFNQNLQITSSLSSDRSNYILTSNTHSSRSRHHRKRRSFKTVETQTSIIEEQKENIQPLSQHRSIPSMGTSHVILRNSQLSSKDNGTDESLSSTHSPINNSLLAKYTPEPIFPPEQSVNSSPQLSNTRINPHENLRSPSLNSDEDLHEVHLHRSPNFPGFGFHLQYNKTFYIIHHIESNSPAERSGLHAKDVIRAVNNHTTDKMPHKTFIQIINANTDVTFLVQTYDNYYRRANHQALRQQTTRPVVETTVNNNNKDDNRHKSVLSRALNKLTSR